MFHLWPFKIRRKHVCAPPCCCVSAVSSLTCLSVTFSWVALIGQIDGEKLSRSTFLGLRWTSSFTEMTLLPSLYGCVCFQRTRRCCWPSPQGSGGSSGTTAGSQLEVWKFCCCCCSSPSVALIRPSIRSSAAGRPTCCLCQRKTEKMAFSARSSGAAGNKELQCRKCDSWNESNVCSLMPI